MLLGVELMHRRIARIRLIIADAVHLVDHKLVAICREPVLLLAENLPHRPKEVE